VAQVVQLDGAPLLGQRLARGALGQAPQQRLGRHGDEPHGVGRRALKVGVDRHQPLDGAARQRRAGGGRGLVLVAFIAAHVVAVAVFSPCRCIRPCCRGCCCCLLGALPGQLAVPLLVRFGQRAPARAELLGDDSHRHFGGGLVVCRGIRRCCCCVAIARHPCSSSRSSCRFIELILDRCTVFFSVYKVCRRGFGRHFFEFVL
jgi:hypothetical protein